MTARYIAVAGNMGSGKSSLVKWLCQQFGTAPFFEPHDENPYLADFYGDMRRWAFPSQLFFLVRRFKIHRELEALGRPVVQDRTLFEDAEIFAAYQRSLGHIDDRDATYQELYTTLRSELRAPDLMIYCRCEVKTLRKRIQQRGRQYEQRASPPRTSRPCMGCTRRGLTATTTRPPSSSRPTAWTTAPSSSTDSVSARPSPRTSTPPPRPRRVSSVPEAPRGLRAGEARVGRRAHRHVLQGRAQVGLDAGRSRNPHPRPRGLLPRRVQEHRGGHPARGGRRRIDEHPLDHLALGPGHPGVPSRAS